jgi:hypothetical protein
MRISFGPAEFKNSDHTVGVVQRSNSHLHPHHPHQQGPTPSAVPVLTHEGCSSSTELSAPNMSNSCSPACALTAGLPSADRALPDHVQAPGLFKESDRSSTTSSLKGVHNAKVSSPTTLSVTSTAPTVTSQGTRNFPCERDAKPGARHPEASGSDKRDKHAEGVRDSAPALCAEVSHRLGTAGADRSLELASSSTALTRLRRITLIPQRFVVFISYFMLIIIASTS